MMNFHVNVVAGSWAKIMWEKLRHSFRDPIRDKKNLQGVAPSKTMEVPK